MTVSRSLLTLFLATTVALAGCGSGGGGTTAADDDLQPDPPVVGSGTLNAAMVDLSTATGGTLGGLNSWAHFLTDNGALVGTSTLASDEQALHAFYLPDPDAAELAAEDIGTLGGLTSTPLAVNATGQVVGESDDASGDFHAFFWKPGDTSPTRIGTTFGGNQSAATAINASGQVVGWAKNASGQRRAFLWNSSTKVLTELPDLGGGEAKALAINASGQVVGTSKTGKVPYDGDWHAFLWDATNGMIDLTRLDDLYSASAQFINDHGEAVGQLIPSSGETHAFYYDPLAGEASEIFPLGEGFEIGISDFNNAGQAVGWSEFQSSPLTAYNDTRAFLWEADTKSLTDLGTLAGQKQSGAMAINEDGTVVGWSKDGERATGTKTAVTWSAATGAITDLGLLYSNGGHTVANAINASGRIAGEGDLLGGDDLYIAWISQ